MNEGMYALCKDDDTWHTLGEIYESYPKVSPQIDQRNVSFYHLLSVVCFFPCPEICTVPQPNLEGVDVENQETSGSRGST